MKTVLLIIKLTLDGIFLFQGNKELPIQLTCEQVPLAW